MKITTESADQPGSREPANGLGERLRYARGKDTQAEFGAKLGVHANTLARYEKGERLQLAQLLEQICRQRPNLNPAWLLTGEGDPQLDQVREARPAYASDACGSTLDADLLTDIIEAIEQVMAERKIALKAAKKARLILELYERFRERCIVDKATVIRLVDLAA